jgi:hypothetical protein
VALTLTSVRNCSADSLRAVRPSIYRPYDLTARHEDDIVQASLAEDFLPIRDLLATDWEVDRVISSIITYLPVLWRQFGSNNMSAVEIGCGSGLRSSIWSRVFRSYIGVDISAPDITRAEAVARQLGRENLRFVTGNAAHVLSNPDKYGIRDTPDILIIYAALEHMTIKERETVLRAAGELVDRGLKYIFIGETPNRLIPFDGHSSYLHFFSWLPPELALQYIHKSGRTDARELAHVENGLEALYRFGRGVSFHEFELYLDAQVGCTPTVALDGWDVGILNHEPIRRSELELSAYCSANCIQVARWFSRYWLEAILDFSSSPSAAGSAPLLIRPHEGAGIRFESRPAFWTLDRYRCGPNTLSEFTFPDVLEGQWSRLGILVDVSESAGTMQVRDRSGTVVAELDLDAVKAGRIRRWHDQAAIELPLSLVSDGYLALCPDGGTSSLVGEGIVLL